MPTQIEEYNFYQYNDRKRQVIDKYKFNWKKIEQKQKEKKT